MHTFAITKKILIETKYIKIMLQVFLYITFIIKFFVFGRFSVFSLYLSQQGERVDVLTVRSRTQSGLASKPTRTSCKTFSP